MLTEARHTYAKARFGGPPAESEDVSGLLESEPKANADRLEKQFAPLTALPAGLLDALADLRQHLAMQNMLGAKLSIRQRYTLDLLNRLFDEIYSAPPEDPFVLSALEEAERLLHRG